MVLFGRKGRVNVSNKVATCNYKNSVSIKHVSKYFNDFCALKDITLNIKKGSIHALLGENGAGKSTLMNILYGFYRADSGEIFINGEKVNIPSYKLKPGDKVMLREKSRKTELFVNTFKENELNNLPYIEKDIDNFVGTYVREPKRDELPIEIDEQLIVEFYSK